MFNNILETIGNTPIVKIEKLDKDYADIYVKVESRNPSGSIKDRAALYIMNDFIEKGLVKKGGTVIEATSGNTGVAISMIGAVLGINVIIVMPETMTIERRRLMKAYGAELVLTPGSEGMQGAVNKAKELSEELNAPIVGQFVNPANVQAHIETTGKEILKEIPDLNGFVAGIGTGGTVTGIGKVLKEANKDIVVWGVEPKSSPLLTEGKSGSHKIQGIGANFVPEIYNPKFIDKVEQVSDEAAIENSLSLARNHGILSGISAGANFSAGKKLAKELGEGKKVLVILPDSGERYLSSGIFDD